MIKSKETKINELSHFHFQSVSSFETDSEVTLCNFEEKYRVF